VGVKGAQPLYQGENAGIAVREGGLEVDPEREKKKKKKKTQKSLRNKKGARTQGVEGKEGGKRKNKNGKGKARGGAKEKIRTKGK